MDANGQIINYDQVINGLAILINHVTINIKDEKELSIAITELNQMEQALEQLQSTITNYIKNIDFFQRPEGVVQSDNKIQFLFQLQDDLTMLIKKIENERKNMTNLIYKWTSANKLHLNNKKK